MPRSNRKIQFCTGTLIFLFSNLESCMNVKARKDGKMYYNGKIWIMTFINKRDLPG